MIINSKNERNIGLGRYFSQRILNITDLIANNQALRYVKADPMMNDDVQFVVSYDQIKPLLNSSVSMRSGGNQGRQGRINNITNRLD